MLSPVLKPPGDPVPPVLPPKPPLGPVLNPPVPELNPPVPVPALKLLLAPLKLLPLLLNAPLEDAPKLAPPPRLLPENPALLAELPPPEVPPMLLMVST